MNRGLSFALVLAAILAVTFAGEDKYTDKYDNVDIDSILQNDRLLHNYMNCLMANTDAHCTPEGRELRKAIPEALTNECAKCTDKQKRGALKVIRYLHDHRPEAWERLQGKWDPQGIYRTKYAERLQ